MKNGQINYKKLNFRDILGWFKGGVYIPILKFIDKAQDYKIIFLVLKLKILGVKTRGIIELPSLGIDPSFGNRYETASFKTLNHLLKFARKKGFTSILDIGCGCGRPLIVANEVGFLNFYGVDISEKLIDRCNSNLEKLKIKSQLTCCDSFDYLIPNMDLVVYLSNPFSEERVCSIVKELEARKEKYLFIYHRPKHTNCFPSSPIYKYINRHLGSYLEMAYIYEI